MRTVILASHGHLASGMKNTVEMILGEQEALKAFDAYTTPECNVHDTLEAMIRQADGESPVPSTPAWRRPWQLLWQRLHARPAWHGHKKRCKNQKLGADAQTPSFLRHTDHHKQRDAKPESGEAYSFPAFSIFFTSYRSLHSAVYSRRISSSAGARSGTITVTKPPRAPARTPL